ncbi:PREDICTED: uncharacterized protein LOC109236808 [Nicotiana attenuata]|uniref:PB1 domain-containing protein n=1 Tax=Nicotiana attenuata TaxID=49451 RepID=A0A314LHE5_NICAT|nr:PREDICTED: uncharacterized protein LOC109236808 [Nicotiana attenuata]OIT40439.1 hypothetical protein A4A49_08561 [Nicotiana attenuata]
MVGPSINSRNVPLKFLCSYGGKIIPRHTDGKLRYYGGESRVLSVHPCISFAELMVKLGEMCGASVSLRCQLPNEDLDALVSITCDEDLANLIEEYDHASTLKIRAFLLPPKSTKLKLVSSPPSISSTSSTTTTISNHDATSPDSSFSSTATTVNSSKYRNCPRSYKETSYSCVRHTRTRSLPVMCHEKVAGKIPQYAYHGHENNSGHIYLSHHGHHWQ